MSELRFTLTAFARTLPGPLRRQSEDDLLLEVGERAGAPADTPLAQIAATLRAMGFIVERRARHGDEPGFYFMLALPARPRGS